MESIVQNSIRKFLYLRIENMHQNSECDFFMFDIHLMEIQKCKVKIPNILHSLSKAKILTSIDVNTLEFSHNLQNESG